MRGCKVGFFGAADVLAAMTFQPILIAPPPPAHPGDEGQTKCCQLDGGCLHCSTWGKKIHEKVPTQNKQPITHHPTATYPNCSTAPGAPRRQGQHSPMLRMSECVISRLAKEQRWEVMHPPHQHTPQKRHPRTHTATPRATHYPILAEPLPPPLPYPRCAIASAAPRRWQSFPCPPPRGPALEQGG